MLKSDANYTNVKFSEALSAYSSKYSPFLKTCMLKAGFIVEEVDECNSNYQIFSTLAARIELRRLNKLVVAYKSNVTVPIDKIGTSIPESIEEEPKMKKSICNFHIESASFIVTCMQAGRFESEETDECDAMYLSFMSYALQQEIDRLVRLKRSHEKSSTLTNRFNENTSTYTVSTSSASGSNVMIGNVDNHLDINDFLKNSCHINHSFHFDVYRASNSKQNIAIKVIANKDNQDQGVKRIKDEFDVCSKIQHVGLRKALFQKIINGKQAILLEWVEGKTITECGKFSVKQFLRVAREIVSTLTALHSEKIIHGNLTTDNIIFDSQTKTVKIIGLSSFLKFNEKSNEVRLGSDFCFMSPEQAGLTDHNIDIRSDFYSLGIIFYIMLSGNPPFETTTLSDLSDIYLFSEAKLLHTLDPSIPRLLSDFVSKLMEKQAGGRYRSTKGVLFDLEMMLSESENNSSLNSSVLAQHDVPEDLIIPQKLYGRGSEKEKLFQVFAKSCSGSFELLLITGSSGVGKSSLALEICKPLSKKKGYLIKGKYDQLRQNEPYSAIISAFWNFFDSLLAGNNSVLNYFAKHIKKAVGNEGRVLTDIIRNLERIIGTQGKIDEVIGSDAKNRFNYVFCNFIQSICHRHHPIVIVLDDIQWADIDSLNLLLTLVSKKSIKNFMIIGIYRDEDINSTLSTTLSKIKETKIRLNFIKLKNLEIGEINELVADALSMSTLETIPLTAYVQNRTCGNALYALQYLKFLKEEGFLFFCPKRNSWKWKEFDITAVADSVTDFTRKKILKLNEETQKAIIAASCLGFTFSLSDLGLIFNNSTAIENAINEGIFVPSSGSKKKYRFVHDCTLQAAISLIPSQDRTALYLHNGRLLWKNAYFQRSNEEGTFFVVVSMLNAAVDLIIDSCERIEVAKLNLTAGIQAMSATAFWPATQYFSAGINILGSDNWSKNYALTLKLCNAAAGAAYCSKDSQALQTLTVDIFSRARCLQDKMHSYLLHIKALVDSYKYKEAVNVGLNVLHQLGEQLPSQPEDEYLKQKLFEISSRISEENFDPLLLNTMEDEEATSKMQLLGMIHHAVFYTMPKLLSLIGVRMVELTLTNGTSKYSTIGFSLVAGDLCAYQKMKEGYTTATIALRLQDMYPSKEILPSVYINIYHCVTYWTDHMQGSLNPFLHGYRVSLEAGNNDLAYICYASYCDLGLNSGASLITLKENMDENEDAFENKPSLSCTHQIILNFLGLGSKNSYLPIGDIFDLKEFNAEHVHGADLSFIYGSCIMIAYYFHEFDAARDLIEKCRKYIQYVDRNLQKIHFIFYDCLTELALTSKNRELCDTWKDKVKKCKSMLKGYSEISPTNFLNKFRLIEAELHSVENNIAQAKACYKEAILHSKANNFNHEEALSLERAGMFHLKIGENRDALIMLNHSYQVYQRWGAFAKMNHLKMLNPGIKFKNASSRTSFVFDVGKSSDSVSEITQAFSLHNSSSEGSSHSGSMGQGRVSGNKRVRWKFSKD